MRPTKYNRRISVLAPTETTTSTGGISVTYAVDYTSWASVKPVSGRKRLEYGRTEYNYIYEVEMRARTTNPDVNNKIRYAGNDYAITGISIDEDEGKVNIDIAR